MRTISKITLTLFVSVIFFAPLSASADIQKDILIKGTMSSSVYYYAGDGKRYVFPNQSIYYSWFTNFDSVITVSDLELAKLPIGGNITYRPGIKMIKIQSDPKVYAVDKNKVLRWIQTEVIAQTLYGTLWNTRIHDVPVTFFTDYTIGEEITNSSNFHPPTVVNEVNTINKNRNIIENENTLKSDTTLIIDEYDKNLDENSFKNIMQEKIHELTNSERSNNGLEKMEFDTELESIAYNHSRDMFERDYFDHSDPEGCNITCRLENNNYDAWAWGENIAWRLDTQIEDPEKLAEIFVSGWMDSTGHRENILYDTYTHHGVGVFRVGDETFATANFSKPK